MAKLKDLVEQYGEYDVPQELINKFEPPKPESIWKLKDGNIYYFITSSGKVDVIFWDGSVTDRERLQTGNVFLTKDDALKEIERREVETLLLKHGGRRIFDSSKLNYFVDLSADEKSLQVTGVIFSPSQGMIYFDSADLIEKAIKEIGEERIMKALFEAI